MTISTLERASAALQEEVHGQWRDWSRYLQAHLTLLDARAAERRVIFERNDALEEQTKQAQAILAALPPARRMLFDTIREERRQTVQAALETEHAGRTLDPDTVERQAIQALLAEAMGSEDQAGWGCVPFREGETITWYEVNPQRLGTAPTAASYALGARDMGDLRTRYLFAGLLVTSGVLFLLVWFLWPQGSSRNAASAPPVVFANEQALQPWPVLRVLVEPTSGDPATLPVIARATAHWPASTDAAPSAGWDRQHLAPLRLCLPADVLAAARQITLVSGNGTPDRVYVLAAAPSGSADLVLEPCTGSAPSRVAQLQQTIVVPDASPGTTQTLSDGKEVILEAITLIGPGDDPTLPAGQARLTVHARADLSDWVAYAPTLLLSSGQALLPAEPPTPEGDTTLVRYLVPLPTTDLVVVWSLTAPGSERAARWRATLPAPPDRASVVRTALGVNQVAAVFDGRTTVTITVTVRNEHAAPFLLAPDDLRLTVGASTDTLPLTFTPADVLQAPLLPNTTRTLTITAPLRERAADLTLTIGTNRFRLVPNP